MFSLEIIYSPVTSILSPTRGEEATRNTRIFRITLEELEGERWVLKWLIKFIVTQRPPAAKKRPALPALGLRVCGAAGWPAG